MHRRNILWGAISAFGAAIAASRAGAASEAAPPAKLKVVYHLNDLDKVSFVLGNIQNHLDGVGGPDHVTIALVVHGQALRAFHSASANPEGFAAGLCCRRARRRGADRRAAIAGLSLPPTLKRCQST